MIQASSSSCSEDLIHELLEQILAASEPAAELERLAQQHPECEDALREAYRVVEILKGTPSLAPTTPQEYGNVAVPPMIGKYDIEGEIARGGMGIVYRGRDRELDRVVAVKTLQNSEARARFSNEQKYLARFHETNIVALYFAGDHNGRPYMVMPFIEGAPLHHVVSAGRRFSSHADSADSATSVAALAAISQDAEWRAATGKAPHVEADDYPQVGTDYFQSVAQCIADIAGATQAMHQQKLIHRDLKPENVMVDEDGQSWIIDLGIARELKPDEETLVKDDCAGTLPYMAPEQFQNEFGVSTDVWGLGMILFELLTFRRAYRVPLDKIPDAERSEAKTVEHFLQHQESRKREVDVLGVSRRIPVDLAAVCQKCLRLKPEDRYHSAEELSEDLKRWLRHEPVTARPIGWPARFGKWSKRHPGWAVLFASLFLGLLAGSIGLFAHSRQLAQSLSETQDREETIRQIKLAYDTDLGFQAWADGDKDRMIFHLHDAVGNSETDSKSWEWYFLNGLCQTEMAVFEQREPATAITFLAANGELLCSGDEAGTIRVWRIGQQEPARIIDAHEVRINHLVTSADHRFVASACAEGRMRAWKLPDWTAMHDLTLHGASANVLAISPDARLLASGGDDGLVFVIDVESGKTRRVLVEGEPVRSLDFSRDGSILAVGAEGNVRAYETTTWKRIINYRNGTNGIRFDQDGTLLIAQKDDTVQRIDLVDKPPRVFLREGGKSARDILISPDGESVYLAREDGSIVSFTNGERGRRKRVLPGHRKRFNRRDRQWEGIHQVRVSTDGARLASCGEDGTVRVWNLETPPELSVLSGHDITVYSLAVNRQGTLIASGSFDHTVRIWDWKKRQAVAQFGHTNIKKDERGLPLTAKTISGHTNIVTGVAFSPDGKSVASSSFDRTVRIWGLESKKEEKRFWHPLAVIDVAFDPAGDQIATACWDDLVRVYDLESNKLVCELAGHAAHLQRLVFVRSKLLASTDENGVIRLWDTTDGKEVRNWYAHEGPIRAVAVNPKRGWIATGGDDQRIRIWKVETGEPVMQLVAQHGGIRGLSFHPSEPRLAAVGRGKPGIAVWNLDSKQRVATLDGSGDVHFSPDGWRLVSAGSQYTINVWNAEHGKGLEAPAQLSLSPILRKPTALKPAQGVRVIGYRYATKVVDGLRRGKFRRPSTDNRYLIVAVSVPAQVLTPSGVEYAECVKQRKAKKRGPLAPRDRVRYVYPKLFHLLRKGKDDLAAKLIDDWPDVEGFHVGYTRESTEPTQSDGRQIVAVVWEVPKSDDGELPAVRVRDGKPVQIPDRQLTFGRAVIE